MKKLKEPSTFAFGLIFGTLIGLIIWYWYKSTSAEDGALDLLDKMAMADAKIRQLERKLRTESFDEAQEPSVETYISLEPTEPNNGTLPPFLAEEIAADETPKSSEDLQRVKGIGPVFARKLQAVDIDTLAELTAVSPERLAELLDIHESRAESILAEAQRIQ